MYNRLYSNIKNYYEFYFKFLNIDDLFILKETLKNEFICYYDEIQYNNLDWDEDHALDMVLMEHQNLKENGFILEVKIFQIGNLLLDT